MYTEARWGKPLRSGLRRELLEAHLPLSADNRATVRRSNLKQISSADTVSDICTCTVHTILQHGLTSISLLVERRAGNDVLLE